MSLLKKITNRTARIGVIGLGYVGLPLVIEFVRAGFTVTGFDLDGGKVSALKEGKSYIKHIDVGPLVAKTGAMGESFRPTTDFSALKDMDAILVCVPTPLNRNREPDMTYVFETTRTIARHQRERQLVILESTTYPGTTDEDMRTILEEGGLVAGVDFHLAFSPEREDPNNRDFSLKTVPKVVGGYTPRCLELAQTLYETIVDKVVPVSSTKVAEAAKLLENIYRSVNIALVNELKILFDRMGIDVWEVIEAAKTKPFGFQAFYPGPGLGGHCIPIDPFYLTWKAREYDFATRFIELAGEINTNMPYFVVGKVAEAFNDQRKSLKGSKVLIVGVAYKPDIDDERESPAFAVIDLLQKEGALVDYSDPFIPRLKKKRRYNFDKSSVDLTEENIRRYDAVVIVTHHSAIDYEKVERCALLVVDTRNALKKTGLKMGNVYKA